MNSDLGQLQLASTRAPGEVLGTSLNAGEARALQTAEHSSVHIANGMSNMETGMTSTAGS